MSQAAQVQQALMLAGLEDGEDFQFVADHVDERGHMVFALYMKKDEDE